MNSIFEPKPRWTGAPRMCELSNLPSFETQKDAITFHEKSCGLSTLIVFAWLCDWCKGWHYWAEAPAPTIETRRHNGDAPERIETLARRARAWLLRFTESEQEAIRKGKLWAGKIPDL